MHVITSYSIHYTKLYEGCFEPLLDSRQRLIPVGFHQLAVFAYQGLGQAFIAVDIGVAEAAADAEVAGVSYNFV